jgi:3-oxoacyl-[acyl-carrier protein] reductase
MDLGLDGKRAIVTGAASPQGIGRAIALALAREGADIAVADIDVHGAKAVAEEVTDLGRKALALKVDQSVYDEVKEAVIQIDREMGSPDILVNNAALTSGVTPTSASKTAALAWDREVSITLSGVFYWTREVIPLMTKKRWGRIVNISSLAGVIGAPGLSCYSACKGGMIAFTKSVATDVANRGVTVNALSLGFIKTGIYTDSLAAPETVEAITSSLPMGRMGQPDEVAYLAAFLASDKAAYIHGANIVIDGGLTCGYTRPSSG